MPQRFGEKSKRGYMLNRLPGEPVVPTVNNFKLQYFHHEQVKPVPRMIGLVGGGGVMPHEFHHDVNFSLVLKSSFIVKGPVHIKRIGI